MKLPGQNETDIVCAQCGGPVEQIRVERGVFDVVEFRRGTRVRVFCHGDTQATMIPPKTVIPTSGIAFRQGKGIYED